MCNSSHWQVLLNYDLPSPVSGLVYSELRMREAVRAFKRKVRDTGVMCEFGRPLESTDLGKVLPSSAALRCMEIDTSRHCAKLVDVSSSGRGLVAGEFVFTGPFGDEAERLFVEGDAHFSMRALTPAPAPSVDDNARNVTNIITFDLISGQSLAFGDVVCKVAPQPRFFVRGEEISLTHPESLIFHALIESMSHGEILTKAILDYRARRPSSKAYSNVHEVQIGRIRKKLKAAGSEVKISSVRGMGYILNYQE